ncbi:hypothetical protein QYE76_034103 [Lolium multiflorum]|uniref:Reverse transcriptase zinc-binding domain-containing protein n=1 Tax=Lolium multiflorum TaxID=4521 RepID=A0AAD8VMQ6_LOLMU|nr:hypothetical protein QYE76_034103 [Lolium multiflorum]
MAASSSSSVPLNLGSPPSTKLTRSNFIFWKTLVFPILRGAQVYGLLDGTDKAPEKFLEIEDSEKKKKIIPNSEYAAWVARDQTVLGYLVNSFSPEIVAHVSGLESTAEVWAVITKMLSSQSRSKVNHLRGALNSTKKLDLTTAQYFAKMKGFCSELASVANLLMKMSSWGTSLMGLMVPTIILLMLSMATLALPLMNFLIRCVHMICAKLSFWSLEMFLFHPPMPPAVLPTTARVAAKMMTVGGVTSRVVMMIVCAEMSNVAVMMGGVVMKDAAVMIGLAVMRAAAMKIAGMIVEIVVMRVAAMMIAVMIAGTAGAVVKVALGFVVVLLLLLWMLLVRYALYMGTRLVIAGGDSNVMDQLMMMIGALTKLPILPLMELIQIDHSSSEDYTGGESFMQNGEETSSNEADTDAEFDATENSSADNEDDPLIALDRAGADPQEDAGTGVSSSPSAPTSPPLSPGPATRSPDPAPSPVCVDAVRVDAPSAPDPDAPSTVRVDSTPASGRLPASDSTPSSDRVTVMSRSRQESPGRPEPDQHAAAGSSMHPGTAAIRVLPELVAPPVSGVRTRLQKEKPWVGSETPIDASDLDLFNAATLVTIGDGAKASFWSSSWLNGTPPKDLAPLIYVASKRKNRTVRDALEGHNWVADISVEAFTVDHMEQYVRLWDLLSAVQLSPGTEDSIVWTLTPKGCYTASSAYKAQFLPALPCSFGNIVWKPWAPPKCRFFAWLAVQNRLWTADRLAKRGWPHQPSCQLCRCSPETARHLLFECRFSKRIWIAAASWLDCPDLIRCLGAGRSRVLDYWHAIAKTPTSSPKGLRTAIMLISWEIWKERNERVFNNKSSLPLVVMQKIKDEGKDWVLAGAKNLAELIG